MSLSVTILKFLRKKVHFPFYPLLFAIYPVLFLWGANRAQNSAYVVVPPLFVTLIAAGLLFVLSGVILHNKYQAAFATFFISFYILVLGHVVNLLSGFQIDIQYRYVAPTLLFLPSVFLIARKFALKRFASVMNPICLALVLLAILPTGYYYIFSASQKVISPEQEVPRAAQPAKAQKDLPDVYLIIMDGYSREDWFRSRFDFDNHIFINALKDRGFYLPDCAQSNYPATTPTIASILNMNYLDQMGLNQSAVLTEAGSEALGPYIQDNLVFQTFRSFGYRIVTFRGFLSLIDLQNVDFYVDFEKDVSFSQRIETANFQDLYIRTTAFYGYKTILESLRRYFPEIAQKIIPDTQRYEKIRQQNIYAVNMLKKLPNQVESPKLVYAHLYASHWPYFLNPDGSARLPYSEAETDEGYLAGVQYLNNNMLDVIDNILKNSKTPPVIILQSDHAYPEEEGAPDWSGINRVLNFNAYFLPNGGEQLLSDKTTPVNDFRIVFSHYFKQNIKLLPDISYYVRPDNGKVEIAPATCISR